VGVEELSNGGGDGSRGLGSLGAVMAGLVVVIGIVLLLPGHHSATSQADDVMPPVPLTSHPARLEGSTSTSSAAPLDPGRYLSVGKVCAAMTDHGSLVVSFELINFGLTDVTVISVKPASPLDGLRPVGGTTSGGNCGRPGSQAVGGLLFAGDRAMFTIRFQVPKPCPLRRSGRATVGVKVAQMVGMTSTQVTSDPGSVSFEACPAAGGKRSG
jgi:hypothetical protein